MFTVCCYRDDLFVNKQVRELGFDEESARAALLQFKDVQRAIEELMKVGGIAPPAWLESLMHNSARPSSAGSDEGTTGTDATLIYSDLFT